jgi:transposase InsO family protein
VLKVSRSTYYKTKNHKPSPKALEKKHLQKRIKDIWLKNKKRYGSPKIHKILLKEGELISIKRVQRYMKELKICSIVVKKYRYYSSPSKSYGKENLLNQDFRTSRINQKWSTDITYIHTIKDGWTYLASVMDLHSKKIIGYSHSCLC